VTLERSAAVTSIEPTAFGATRSLRLQSRLSAILPTLARNDEPVSALDEDEPVSALDEDEPVSALDEDEPVSALDEDEPVSAQADVETVSWVIGEWLSSRSNASTPTV
jgi:hypothetical protein